MTERGDLLNILRHSGLSPTDLIRTIYANLATPFVTPRVVEISGRVVLFLPGIIMNWRDFIICRISTAFDN